MATQNTPHTDKQPLSAINQPDALLTVETVSALIGLSRSSVYQFETEGRFPRAIRLGTRCTRWRAGDVSEWLKAQTPSAPTPKEAKAPKAAKTAGAAL